MFALDTKSMQKIAPVVRRVVVVDPNPAGAKLMAELLKGFGCRDVAMESDDARVVDLAREMEPGLFIIERSGPKLDGEALARRIRRSSLSTRRAPIIMVTAEATASSIKGARDAGVHEFLRKPFTSGDLYRRIENLATKPRDWVEAVGYVGPDRRRFNSVDYAGPRKRKADEGGAPTLDGIKDQSMRILASALVQFSSDPAQAVRAIGEQGKTLKMLAVKTGDTALALAAVGLQTELEMGRTSLEQLNGPVKAILALAPSKSLARQG
ncbi:response regulator [Brevundimonas sp.]|uniref:response regulator n=1 Tax=Brevundimonas sp. TaxID=1871086 RepID=UPI0028A18739|nr:response regulator [Brevundimonas sp.]